METKKYFDSVLLNLFENTTRVDEVTDIWKALIARYFDDIPEPEVVATELVEVLKECQSSKPSLVSQRLHATFLGYTMKSKRSTTDLRLLQQDHATLIFSRVLQKTYFYSNLIVSDLAPLMIKKEDYPTKLLTIKEFSTLTDRESRVFDTGLLHLTSLIDDLKAMQKKSYECTIIHLNEYAFTFMIEHDTIKSLLLYLANITKTRIMFLYQANPAQEIKNVEINQLARRMFFDVIVSGQLLLSHNRVHRITKFISDYMKVLGFHFDGTSEMGDPQSLYTLYRLDYKS